MQLKQMECEACQAGAPQVPQAERAGLLAQLPDWEIVEVEGVSRLRRTFRFRNFAEALAFTNQVGELAESANHHPEIVTAWGQVQVSWWTHKIGGLHKNDFIMAARTDQLD